jgi:FkbM family methyltransferase
MSANVATFERDLIFDIGASCGSDSAYYLHKGYRVVAVEANPSSAARLRERFATEIAAGRLSLVEMAIAASDGKAPFWICDDLPGWSSFDRAIASYRGARHHGICVPTCRFSSLLDRFGIPFYCKIDIEGSDSLCLEDMTGSTKPRFVSVELPTNGSVPKKELARLIMDRLETLAYTKFKVISQVTFRQPVRPLLALKAHLPAAMSLRITRLDKAFRRLANHGWIFGEDSSGPFADDTPGAWVNASEARRLIASVQSNDDISDWYDLHAAVS